MISQINIQSNWSEELQEVVRIINRQIIVPLVNQSQGKTNPSSNIQNFTTSPVVFNTDGSGNAQIINILNKLSIDAKSVVLASIARTDNVAIPGSPQIVWAMNGKNITIQSIGGLVANTSYSATFTANI